MRKLSPKRIILLFIIGFFAISGNLYSQSSSLGNTFIFNNGEFAIVDIQHSFLNGGSGIQPGIVGTDRTTTSGFMSFLGTASWTGVSDAAFVDGYVKTYETTAFTFPIGDNGKYRPAAVSAATLANPANAAYYGVSGTLAITSRLPGGNEPVLPASGPFNTSLTGTSVGSVDNVEYWDINGATSAKITLTWDNNSNIASLSSLTIVGWNGAQWVAIPSTVDTTSLLGSSSSLSTGSITTNSVLVPNTYEVYTLGTICNAGTNAPILSSTSISNACPTTTVNLNSLVTSSTPSGASLIWFTNNTHTGVAYTTPDLATEGTYYAFYHDAINTCYSPATAAVSVVKVCCAGDIPPTVGVITNLNGVAVTNSGILYKNSITSNGVTSVFSYSGGNGGNHNGQVVTSTGITGLTATLSAGTLAAGTGTLIYTITGIPSASGTATFAINIGGQSYNLTRNVTEIVTTNPIGTGTFSGKTCFDIALSNDNTNSCGPLSVRSSTKSDFTLTATNTQTYTFIPNGTVSNVRFVYINTNGSPITAILGGNSGNNISTAQSAVVNYSTSLNTAASGLTATNALTADVYVVYNDGATNNGTDVQLKLTANIKDCSCCGAFVAAGVYKTFMCHNLGADTSLDPNVPVQGIHGNYYQWGRNTIIANASTSASALPGWNATAAGEGSWSDTVKTANDPCPVGYRIPTLTQWEGVINNNTSTRIGSWLNMGSNFSSALCFGPNTSTTTLTLPAAGERSVSNGTLSMRGSRAFYWSSTYFNITYGSFCIYGGGSDMPIHSSNYPSISGQSLRCISQ